MGNYLKSSLIGEEAMTDIVGAKILEVIDLEVENFEFKIITDKGNYIAYCDHDYYERTYIDSICGYIKKDAVIISFEERSDITHNLYTVKTTLGECIIIWENSSNNGINFYKELN